MGPLAGIKVLDLSRILAGPWATQCLADFGATVWKIEKPGTGDDTRHWGPPWIPDGAGQPTEDSAYYASANRGKHSIAVDFTKPAGQQLVRSLAQRADVILRQADEGIELPQRAGRALQAQAVGGGHEVRESGGIGSEPGGGAERGVDRGDPGRLGAEDEVGRRERVGGVGLTKDGDVGEADGPGQRRRIGDGGSETGRAVAATDLALY